MKTCLVAICIAIGLAALFSTTIAFSKSEERTILNIFVLVFGMNEGLLGEELTLDDVKAELLISKEEARKKYTELDEKKFTISPLTSELYRTAITCVFTVDTFLNLFTIIFSSLDVNKTTYSADDCLSAFEKIESTQLSDLGSILVFTLSDTRQYRDIEKYLILIRVLNTEPRRTLDSISAAFGEFATNGFIEMPEGQQDTNSKFLKRYRGEPCSPSPEEPIPPIF